MVVGLQRLMGRLLESPKSSLAPELAGNGRKGSLNLKCIHQYCFIIQKGAMGAARDSDRGWSPAYQGIPFEPMSLHFLGVSSAIFSSVSFFFLYLVWKRFCVSSERRQWLQLRHVLTPCHFTTDHSQKTKRLQGWKTCMTWIFNDTSQCEPVPRFSFLMLDILSAI
jgi:hypothetical protein